MQTDELVGTWSLESCVAKGSDGSEGLPFGEAPKGLLSYTRGGYMAAVLMRRGRPKFASGDPLGGTPEELQLAFEGFDAYAGTFEFDEAKGIVTHYAAVARFPDWEDTAQVRFVKLVDCKLHLETPPIFALGLTWINTLVWCRVGEG